jgi:hypothetical protein
MNRTCANCRFAEDQPDDTSSPCYPCYELSHWKAPLEWNASPADVQDEEILATAAAAGYPDDNPKTAIGVRKPMLSVLPPVALFQMGQAMKDGKEKYGLMNWRQHRVSSSVYYDAAMRHIMSWWDGEQRAQDSGVHHLAHAMACLAILLDAESIGKLNDDRPLAGNLPTFIADNTKAAA